MKIRNANIFQTVAALIIAAAFIIGTAGVSEAAKKKKAITQPPKQPFCTMVRKPVCAEKGKQRFTYANSCFAANDGAKIVADGACKAPKKAKAKKKKGKKAKKGKKGKK